MNIGNLIGDMIFVFVIILLIFWGIIVVTNMIFKGLILHHLYKNNKLHLKKYALEEFIWTIKNCFLFYAFRKKYYVDYRKIYGYYQIKSPKYRDWVDKSAKIMRIGAIALNILFVISLIIILFLPFSIDLFKLIFKI